MKKYYFFGWHNIKRFVRDIYATLSNEESYLSSKRLTTWSANNIVFGLTIFFVVVQTWRDKLDATGFILAIGPVTVMGGYNVAMGMKAKKDEGNINLDDKKEDNKQTNIENDK